MAKKNKRTTHSPQQNREQEAQKLKIFINRTRALMARLVSQEASEVISKEYLKFVYNTFPKFARYQSPTTKQDGGQASKISKYILNQTSVQTFQFPYDKGKEISVKDFFEIWRPLMLSFDMDIVKINKQLRKDASRIVDLLQPHVLKHIEPEDIGTKYDQSDHKYPFMLLQIYAYEIMRSILAVVGQALSHPCVEYTWLSMPALDDNNYMVPIHVELHKMKAEKTLIELNNESWTVYRLYWHSNNMNLVPVSVKVPKNPKLPLELSEKYDVFIHPHAIDRMLERLYGLDQSNIFREFFASFYKSKILWFDNQLLIEYKTNEIKTGYLLAMLHENNVIVSSFLFLTCKNTPEGKQFHELAELQKDDIPFLHIDKLSTFMEIDFKQEKRLVAIFKTCGLGNLIDNIKNIQETKDEDIEIKQIKKDYIVEFMEKAKLMQDKDLTEGAPVHNEETG